jgi:hypothetical protein
MKNLVARKSGIDMRPEEFKYCQRAMLELEKPLTVMQRIKIQRTVAQIMERSAAKLEETFVADVEDRLYAVENG